MKRSALLLALVFAANAYGASPAPSTAKAGPWKGLSTTNDLTKLFPAEPVVPDELERLLEQAEVVAFRDATHGVSPQSLTYAMLLERNLDAYPQKALKPTRVLIELAKVLATLGPQSAGRFYPQVAIALGMKPNETTPRPQLGRELTEVATWAEHAIDKLGARLPRGEAALDHMQLLVERERYADAATYGKSHVTGAVADSARWQALTGTALLLASDANEKEANALLDKALVHGGEPALLAHAAQGRKWQRDALAQIARTLGDAPPGDACRKMFAHPAGSADGATANACARLLWNEPGRDWLSRAAELVPSGPAGAAVRAADAMAALYAEPRPTTLARTKLAQKALDEIAAMGAADRDLDALKLLVEMGKSDEPSSFVPASGDPVELVARLDAKFPCDPRQLGLRALALRGNGPGLAAFSATVAQRCIAAPRGSQAAIDAIGVLLQLGHSAPPAARIDGVEALAEKLAQTHADDPQTVGLHADAVALHALAHKDPVFALIAALARYEEAIALTTPASGAVTRARLEANAGFLSLAVGDRTPGTTKAGKESKRSFFERAQRHLRFALSVDETGAVLATRAAFDAALGIPLARTAPTLTELPSSPSRQRAACMLAAQAALSKNGAAADRYTQLANTAPPKPRGAKSTVDQLFDTPELLVASATNFNVALDGGGLHPAAEWRTALYLAPPCGDHAPTRSDTKPDLKPAKPSPSPKPTR